MEFWKLLDSYGCRCCGSIVIGEKSNWNSMVGNGVYRVYFVGWKLGVSVFFFVWVFWFN